MRFQQEPGQTAERLGRADDERARRESAAGRLAGRFERDRPLALDGLGGPSHFIDAADLDGQLNVFAELSNFNSVPLQVLGRGFDVARAGRRSAGRRFIGKRIGPVFHFVIARLIGGRLPAIASFLNEALHGDFLGEGVDVMTENDVARSLTGEAISRGNKGVDPLTLSVDFAEAFGYKGLRGEDAILIWRVSVGLRKNGDAIAEADVMGAVTRLGWVRRPTGKAPVPAQAQPVPVASGGSRPTIAEPITHRNGDTNGSSSKEARARRSRDAAARPRTRRRSHGGEAAPAAAAASRSTT